MSLNLAESHPYYESLFLIHTELIGWDTTKPHNIPNFDTDQDIFVYLDAGEPSRLQRTTKKHMDGFDINHLSHTRKHRTHQRTNDLNHLVARLEKKIETNRNDVSNGENPTVTPTDEMIDTLPEHLEEGSSILIEPT